MDKDLIITLGCWICVLMMMYKYKILNSLRNYVLLVILLLFIFLILKISFNAETKDFAFLIVYVVIYQPTRLVLKYILKREPIIYLKGLDLSDEEEKMSNIFDYFYSPFLFLTSLFFSVFYFWDKL
jgi:hypothetical protein